MITDRIGQHEVLLSINHKNYNFREKKNIKVWKGKICNKSFNTVSMLIETKNVIAWFRLQLIELSDNNLATELVENRSFLNQSQSRKM